MVSKVITSTPTIKYLVLLKLIIDSLFVRVENDSLAIIIVRLNYLGACILMKNSHAL